MHATTTAAATSEEPAVGAFLSGPRRPGRRILLGFLPRSPVARDALAIAGAVLAAFFAIEGTGTWTKVFEAVRRNPGLEIDAAILTGVLSILGLLAFSVRRWRELRLEVAARETAEAHGIAVHDALTGLPNRRRLQEELEHALARARRGGGPAAALLIVDLDRFKPVDDVHGHLAGARLLQEAAKRLRAAARENDTVARLGGGEFAVVAELGDDPLDEVARLARRLVAALEAPFELGRATVQIGCGVGVALAQEGDDAGALMRRADMALHRAKAEGRGCFRFFEPGMDGRVRERAALEAEFRLAVARDEIVPHFQPLVDLGSGRLLGFEALARWPHPARGGLVPPSEFIPIAEDTGLIAPMTEQLLRKACRAAAAWPGHLSVAVNVSSMRLRDRNLPGVVRSALEETGLPARRLELELTESALVGNPAREVVAELKALGVRLALDGFGTGYSSPAHLQALPLDKILPFDKLKIDAGFVRAMARDPGARKIVATLVGLGHGLGLPTVAEGVEERGEAEALRRLGCEVGQGWLFGRSMPAEAVDAMLAAGVDAVPS